MLQENLRRELRKRIESGELTGMELARRTGFTQAHISNFLNRKRGLKLSALDRVLRALGLTLYDLLNPRELARFAEAPAGSDAEYREVPLVDPETAAVSEVIVSEDVEGLVKVQQALLERLRPELATPERKTWTRFVLLQLDAREGSNLWPHAAANSVLLVDRHYTSLRPYHRAGRNLYAVRKEERCVVRYVEPASRALLLRPHRLDAALELLPVPEDRSPSDLIVGRVAYVASEI